MWRRRHQDLRRCLASACPLLLPAGPGASAVGSAGAATSLLKASAYHHRADASCTVALVAGLGLAAAAGTAYRLRCPGEPAPIEADKAVAMSNWSGTHTATASRVYSPETQSELEKLVRWADRTGQKIRPIGTGLSPNGLALESRGMLSMAQLDGVVKVDTQRQTITVRAGTRVSVILEELQKHGLTLENFSSITEQQIGGWTQTSAHGTGARIPTVDEMITELTLVTPGRGTLKLNATGPDAELFRWARVGMGTLGVVSEVTLKCIPKFMLHERTYCTTEADLRSNHARLLQTYRHVRYMWVPYTDTIVVVVSDVAAPGASAKAGMPEAERLKPLQGLLRELDPKCGSLEGDNFAQLREKVLVLDPLNAAHVARVNKAEAEFWRRSEGERIGDSTAILGFECGGSQWVLENCFPCGTIDKPSLADIDYVAEIKGIIEREGIAAASPIEQRWTSRSTSPMSPAYSPRAEDIFSWVGVIMYITDEARAPAIKDKFRDYAMRHADLTFKYGGAFHWAKVDLDFHRGRGRMEDLRFHLRKRFDVSGFLELRKSLDPHNIFGNRLTDEALKA